MKNGKRFAAAAAAIVFLTVASIAATAAPSVLSGMQTALRDIAQKVQPAVVEITVTETVQSPYSRTGSQSQQQSGLASGIIVKRSGDTVYVLTNNHVVDGATSVTVQLHDGKEYTASIVGTDSRKDLALVSFTTKEAVTVAELGDSGTLQVGDLVLAVGNPLGFESTVTMGMVSALGRQAQGDVSRYTDYIQTDASINQGNSGGPLVNIDGQVVGINTWIAAPSGGSVGLGFAIPINNAKSAIDQFISKGSVSYGWLGAMIGDIQGSGTDPQYAQDLKLGGVKGAFVFGLYKGSPADKAGLKPGDYVTAVGGTAVTDAGQLTQIIGSLPAGTTTSVTVIRLGAQKTLTATIGERDAKDQVAQSKNLWPGMSVVGLSDSIRQQAGIPSSVKGVIVASLADQGTPAANAGFQPGDVITAVNGKSVATMLDFFKALNDASGKVTFKVVRDGTDMTITM
jgi:Do/DeqQ family serine protease